MPNRQRLSLKLSERGKNLIKELRIKKIEQARQERIGTTGSNERGWNRDEIFLREASKILEPDKNWDNLSEDQYAVSSATWKRFREARQRIDANIFIAFCRVLGLNWKDVAENEVDAKKDLSETPCLSSFCGRTSELSELEQWLIQESCRLVVVHGMGGIGKSALARRLVDKIGDKYDYLIWLSFQQTSLKLVQFLSKGEKEEDDISQLMQYLHQQKCLIVLDAWEEIINNDSEDYTNYSVFVERVAKEAHKSSLLLLSREKNQRIEILKGQLVRFKRLAALTCEEAKEILVAEGLSGTNSELEEFSRRYSNPWILKRIAQSVHTVFQGDVSEFMELSIFVDDVTTEFLDKQFQVLSKDETNLIYWVALRRNSASWHQLLEDTQQFLSINQLFQVLNNLIGRRSLLGKNTEDIPILYVLDPVILKYTTNRFIRESFQEIIQVIKSKNLEGSELFITHSFITENPGYEELNQEQMRRIVKPIQKMLLNQLGRQQLKDELNTVLSLLKNKGLSQGYAYQNISHLISVCQ
jgi:GTPase SAR1 family protein